MGNVSKEIEIIRREKKQTNRNGGDKNHCKRNEECLMGLLVYLTWLRKKIKWNYRT